MISREVSSEVRTHSGTERWVGFLLGEEKGQDCSREKELGAQTQKDGTVLPSCPSRILYYHTQLIFSKLDYIT